MKSSRIGIKTAAQTAAVVAGVDLLAPTVVVTGRDSNWALKILGATGLSIPDVPETTGLVRSKLGNCSA